MKKIYRQKCAIYVKSLKCKSCQASLKMNTQEVKKQIKAQLKNKTYKMSGKTEDQLLKLMKQCKQCKTKNTKKCNLKNYTQFSGADLGQC